MLLMEPLWTVWFSPLSREILARSHEPRFQLRKSKISGGAGSAFLLLEEEKTLGINCSHKPWFIGPITLHLNQALAIAQSS